MVLAFYYVWYRPDPPKWASAIDTPVLGRYYSSDPKVLETHCRWAKEYGIDGFVISFWEGSLDEVRRAVEVFERCGLKYSFYIESGNPFLQIRKLLKAFGSNENLLRVEGKPLIFVYKRVVDRMNVADRWVLQSLLDSVVLSLHGFNGLNGFTSGNMHVYMDLKRGIDWAKEMCDYTHAFGGLCGIPVTPGFEIPHNRRSRVPRRGGRTYEAQWERAIKAGADIVLIASFNEWLENTHVEPSKKFGFLYLDITRRMAKRFKATVKPRRYTFQPVRIEADRLCVLEGGQTSVSLLIRSKLSIPHNYMGCRVVIYDMGELYYPAMVDRLLEYVKRGGTLLLAGGPFPMYSPKGVRPRPVVGRFGLDIGFGPDLKGHFGGVVRVEGEGRDYRYYAVGDTRLRILKNPHSTLYILRRYAEPMGVVVGERRLGRGRVFFLWRGIGEQPYLPIILGEILR